MDKAEYQDCGNFRAVRKGDLMVVYLLDEGFCRGKICEFYVDSKCKKDYFKFCLMNQLIDLFL